MVFMTQRGKVLSIGKSRVLVQSGIALFCLYAGYRFFCFYRWAIGASDVYVSRPPSIEGFLPISALLGLKRIVLTGRYDDIHPAGLTIFLAAIFISFLMRKGFCGWICPVGFVSNLVEKSTKTIRLSMSLPRWFSYPLLSLKYVVLAFFCYIILWQMDIQAVEAFINSPYNKIVDGKMLLFFIAPSSLTLKVLAVLFVVSLFIRNFWCRFLCPYGALLGILALGGACSVRRDESLCVHCKKCDKICPGAVRVSAKAVVRSPECIGCMECVAECPQDGCLTLSAGGKTKVPIYALPVAVLTLFFLFWGIALFTGHWHTTVSPSEARRLYPMSDRFGHP
jgi:polyferredoxin